MMSHFPFHGMSGGTMLLLAAALAPAAAAQDPHSRRQTSAVQQLSRDSSATPRVSGIMRELRCRGKPGIDLRIHQDSSPRYPGYVTMVLRYEPVKPTRAFRQEGMGLVDYGMELALLPGMCTWRWGGGTDVPPEPGVVYFDLPRDAQPGAAPGLRDTTIDAAANFPDPATLPRYLSDPDRYWLFFVDDVTNYSISFGKLGGARPPTPAGSVAGAGAGPVTKASPTRSVPERPIAGKRTVDSSATSVSHDRLAIRSPGVTPSDNVVYGSLPDRPIEGGRPVDTRARALPAESAATRPGDARTSRTRLPERRITDVRTTPGPRGVRLTFHATPSSSAGAGAQPLVAGFPSPSTGMRVQFSSKRPSWDEGERRWSYPAGWDSPWYASIRMPPGGGYEAEPFGHLEAGQFYYYLITASSGDASAPPSQRIGSFTATIGP
ncbi:MAG TPA: hypothetical protein VMN37_05260 [Gemmatimonadales bacterium]|nr:hypothetical protein [Gemmatimonadales bacterium]